MEEALQKMRTSNGSLPQTVEVQRLPSSDTVLLQIHTLAGERKHALQAHVNDTIRDVKRMIGNNASQVLWIVLVSKSEVLKDDTKVGDLPLQKSDTGEQRGTLTLVNVQVDPTKLKYDHAQWCAQGCVSSVHTVSYNGTEIWKRGNGWIEFVDQPSEMSVCIDQDTAQLRVTTSDPESPSPTTELFSVPELVMRANAPQNCDDVLRARMPS
jgi:hypothetical protein